jgi:glucose/arabinose dehydrogenase
MQSQSLQRRSRVPNAFLPIRFLSMLILGVFVVPPVTWRGLAGGEKPGSSPSHSSSAVQGASNLAKVNVPASMRFAPFDTDRSLAIPGGFSISVYARIGGARFMALAPNGDLLVSQPDAGKVSLVRARSGGDPLVSDLLTGLSRPHGIVFHAIAGVTYVYISETNRVDRFIYNSGDTTAASATEGQVVVGGLPDSRTPGLGGSYIHELKNIALDDDDKLYVSLGSSCNVCTEDTESVPVRAAIYQYDADGGNPRLFARGLRNAEGLAFVPGTSDLWAVVNERDDIAYPNNDATGKYGRVIAAYVDNHPPDEFTRVREGANFGWPFCNPNPDTAQGLDNMPFDADFQLNGDGHVDCSSMARIDRGIQAHSAPLGLTFLQGSAFPAAYRDGAVVALHGSWDRRRKTGYKVAFFPWDDGRQAPASQVDLVTGWLNESTQQAWGRPVDAVVDQQGNMFVSDDASGTIYKLAPVVFGAPLITAASMHRGKLFVTGQNFDAGAVVLIDGTPRRTRPDARDPNTLIAKRVRRKIPHGQPVVLQVKDSNGALSPTFSFTRP